MAEAPAARLVVVIPGTAPNLANARMHWAVRMRVVREARALAKILGQNARQLAGWPVPSHATVRAEMHVSRLRDPDGATASLKPWLDGLVDARVIANDDPAHCTLLPVVQVPCRKGFERTEWSVEVADG